MSLMTDFEIAQAQPYEDSMEQLLAGLAYVHLRIEQALAAVRATGRDEHDEFLGLYITDEQANALLSPGHAQHPWYSSNGRRDRCNHGSPDLIQARRVWRQRTAVSRERRIPMRLENLAETFHLTEFEVDILLIAVAPELDPRYERLYAYLQDDVTKKRPTIDLLLNLLTDSLTEKLRRYEDFRTDARLLREQLLVRFQDPGVRSTLLKEYIRPVAVVLEYLLGRPALDARLAEFAVLKTPTGQRGGEPLPGDLVERLSVAATGEPSCIMSLRGAYGVGKTEAAHLVATCRKQSLLTLDLARAVEGELPLGQALPLALRDGRLADAVLYLKEWDAVLQDGRAPRPLLETLLAYPGVVIVAGEQTWQPVGVRSRPLLHVSLDTHSYEARLRAWHTHTEGDLADGEAVLSQLANQFHFTPGQIADAVASARDYAAWQQSPLGPSHLLAASRAHSNQKLATLATKIHPRYDWRDIVLPPDTMSQLREMVASVRGRPTVYGAWGFGRKLALGKGLNVLFAGESGTGKTMAADIIASELEQDLYKIDLSLLVSKYIGETEKNLNRIFTEAATSNAILFFDEADAVFGKRSEVKDSHDRYANIEISYLLQRMEAYDGIVILATNLRANLDDAFTRRLHFVIEFPFPDADSRERIWRVNVPPETPLDPAINFHLLAQRFRLAGGNIRNIIVAAAFLAADKGQVVSMKHLLHAARREYQKMGRLLDERQFAVPRPEQEPVACDS